MVSSCNLVIYMFGQIHLVEGKLKNFVLAFFAEIVNRCRHILHLQELLLNIIGSFELYLGQMLHESEEGVDILGVLHEDGEEEGEVGATLGLALGTLLHVVLCSPRLASTAASVDLDVLES